MNQRHKIDWETFTQDCLKLVPQLQGQQWQGIVAVVRGGLVPAAILAQALDVRLVISVGLASYHGQAQTAIVQTSALNTDIGDGAGWLFVDDLADTGQTGVWLKANYPQAQLAVVYAKPQGAPVVDFWGEVQPQSLWLELPWEVF